MDALRDVFGFAAAAATLTTFAQARMIPMRVAAITANVLFIAYAAMGAFYPVLILHLLLLPINAWRLAIPLGRGRTRLTPAGGTSPLLEAWRRGGCLEPASRGRRLSAASGARAGEKTSRSRADGYEGTGACLTG